MSDFKYLNDGRKVKVLGKLNNEESIVQEIFVTDGGDEIPSGERFVTKSLHDQPVESWKSREEDRHKKNIGRLEAEITSLQKKRNEAESKLKGTQAILSSSAKLCELLPSKELAVFSAFLSGNIGWLVTDSYSFERPVKFDDAIIREDSNWGNRRYDGLKLLSVFGASNGDIEFRIHEYSDGSGMARRTYPFATYEDALAHIKERAMTKHADGKLGIDDFMKCLDMGIAFSPDMVASFEQAIVTQAEARKVKSAEELSRMEAAAEKKDAERLAAIAKTQGRHA